MTELKISDSKERAGQEVNGTAIHGLRERHLAFEEQWLGRLFKGYFNSKLMVLVFLIQAKQHKPEAGVVNGVCCFLDDLYHHMLADSKRKRYRRVFLWLKRFVQKLPNVKTSQRDRALDFVQALYEAVGIDPKPEIKGTYL